MVKAEPVRIPSANPSRAAPPSGVWARTGRDWWPPGSALTERQLHADTGHRQHASLRHFEVGATAILLRPEHLQPGTLARRSVNCGSLIALGAGAPLRDAGLKGHLRGHRHSVAALLCALVLLLAVAKVSAADSQSALEPAVERRSTGDVEIDDTEPLQAESFYTAGLIDNETLMLRPVWLEDDPGFADAWSRMPDRARRLQARARYRAALLDHDGSWRDLERALRITRQELGAQDTVSLSLLVVAVALAEEREDWTTARARIESALSTLERDDGGLLLWRLLFMWRGAHVLMRTGDTAGARRLVAQAVELMSARGWTLQRKVLLNNLGIIQLASGDYKEAVANFEAALLLAGEERARVQSNLALAHWYGGDRDQALKLFRHAHSSRELVPADTLDDRGLLVRNQTLMNELSAMVTVEQGLPPGSHRYGPGIVYARKGELLARHVGASAARTAGRLAAKEQGPREQAGSAPAEIPDGAVLVEMLLYQPLATKPPMNIGETGLLPPHYAAYVFREAGHPVFVDLGPAEPIDRLVVALRRELALPKSFERARDIGRQLDEMLMQPLRPTLEKAAELLIAPEGLLSLLPFAALVDRDGRFLLERHAINYLSSGRDLLRMQTRAPVRDRPLLIVNPAFEGEVPDGARDRPGEQGASTRSRDFQGMRFPALPATAAEGEAIASVMPEALVLAGEAATESAVKAARGPKVLHIATHGFFLEEQRPRPGLRHENAMLRSGLVFAGVASLRSGRDDGVLTAEEAAGLDLAGTQLVVLSACDTGVGEVRTGEGVFGLRRSFVVAGAETLVMSLWEVEDEGTARLMAEFYERLAAGEGRIEALRNVQLGFLADATMRHPFYWAGFIASGQSGPLH